MTVLPLPSLRLQALLCDWLSQPAAALFLSTFTFALLPFYGSISATVKATSVTPAKTLLLSRLLVADSTTTAIEAGYSVTLLLL